MFRYWLQGGRITVGLPGGAQISTASPTSTPRWSAPMTGRKVRRPGGGGAPQIASSCGEVFVTMAMGKRAFVDRLPFVTSMGHGEGRPPPRPPRAR